MEHFIKDKHFLLVASKREDCHLHSCEYLMAFCLHLFLFSSFKNWFSYLEKRCAVLSVSFMEVNLILSSLFLKGVHYFIMLFLQGLSIDGTMFTPARIYSIDHRKEIPSPLQASHSVLHTHRVEGLHSTALAQHFYPCIYSFIKHIAQQLFSWCKDDADRSWHCWEFPVWEKQKYGLKDFIGRSTISILLSLFLVYGVAYPDSSWDNLKHSRLLLCLCKIFLLKLSLQIFWGKKIPVIWCLKNSEYQFLKYGENFFKTWIKMRNHFDIGRNRN